MPNQNIYKKVYIDFIKNISKLKHKLYVKLSA